MFTRNLILLGLFLLVSTASANYVEVTRNAYIYSESNRQSEQVDYIRPKDEQDVVRLEITSDSLENGYYSVRLRDGIREGWIYKSRVRQFEGPIPGGTDVEQSLVQ